MAIDPNELQRTSGCGVQGCLISAVALFVILLIAMLLISVGRFSIMPGGPQQPDSVAPRSPAPPVSIGAFPPSLLDELAPAAATPECHA